MDFTWSRCRRPGTGVASAGLNAQVLKSANSIPRQNLTWLLAKALDLAPMFGRALGLVGVLADYAVWKRSRLTQAGRPLFTHREKLWEHLLCEMNDLNSLRVLEFGVAWGYATQWWLRRLSCRDLEWHGFDVFTGLPIPWDRGGVRVFEAGTFSADGLTPAIADERVRWHVGEIANSIRDFDWASVDARPLLLLMDFDLFEPTMIAMSAALPHLRPGDIIYFDEAYDAWNERRVIDEVLLPSFIVRCHGSTATALALEIVQRRS